MAEANKALDRLATELALDVSTNEHLRLGFGDACALRVEHLLDEPAIRECLATLGRFLARKFPVTMARVPMAINQDL